MRQGGDSSGRLLGAFALLLLIAASASAQSVNSNGRVAVSIESGIFLVKDRNLSFGSLIQPGTAGSIQIPPNGSPVVTSGFVVVATGLSAQFTAGTSVNANQKFWIQLPTTVNLTGPSTLTVRDFIVSSNINPICVRYDASVPTPSQKPSCPTVKLGTSITFQIGATVDLNANQAAGTYTGTFPVTLNNL